MASVECVRRWCVVFLCQEGCPLTTRKLAQGTEYHTCLSLASRSTARWNAEEPARVLVEAQEKVHEEAQVRVHAEEWARVHEACLRTAALGSGSWRVELPSTTDEAVAAA